MHIQRYENSDAMQRLFILSALARYPHESFSARALLCFLFLFLFSLFALLSAVLLAFYYERRPYKHTPHVLTPLLRTHTHAFTASLILSIFFLFMSLPFFCFVHHAASRSPEFPFPICASKQVVHPPKQWRPRLYLFSFHSFQT
jgi:hypothetical protein